MDEFSQQLPESSVPQVTRLIDLRDNSEANPTQMGDDPYIVASGKLADNSGLFTRAGMNLPPSSWEAVLAHIEGIRPGEQISEGGSEAQGVYLLDVPDVQPIVVKVLPEVIEGSPTHGIGKTYTTSPERRLKKTIDADQELHRFSSDQIQLAVTTQYGCLIAPDGTRYWVEALMPGRQLLSVLNGFGSSRDQELYQNLKQAGKVAARTLGVASGELLFVKDEVRVSWDDSQPPRFYITVTDVADFN